MTPALDSDPDDPVTAVLYCRASTTTATAIDRYHSALTELSNAGVLDGVEVVTWPTRVELSAGADSVAADAYDRFAEWADEEGCRLAPAFDVEAYESTFTGESGTALVTPVVSVAVYEDDELAAVYPYVEDGEVVDVDDGIDRLRGRSGPKADGGPAVTTAPAEE